MNDPTARRTTGTIVAYALGRWQTLAVVLLAAAGITLTILLLGPNALIIGAWLTLGIVGVVGMVVVSFRDERSVEEALAIPIDPNDLRIPGLREAVRRAREYREAIRIAVRTIQSPELRASLLTITRPADDPAWLIYTLGRRIEAFRDDRIIQADLSRLRGEERTGQLSVAEKEHLAELDKLAGLVDEAETKIDATLSQLGASYAEVQTIGAAGDIRGGKVELALGELKQRSLELSSISSALEEVYGRQRT